MEYVYGALLLHAAGKEVDEEKLKKVLEDVGVQVDEARLKTLVSGLKDVNIDEVLKNATVAPVAAAPAAPQEKKEEPKKKEEKKKEENKEQEEEEAMSGLSALFG
ncbi:ribosomal protein large subunit P2 [Thermoplasma volcanium GSS1]|uniref:Large ribosomal subunit protein P1 n=1 Tax=Thermoplasma volcanium (strain ATCC 51530 / DSM 4299 / JCM 9571 / NBRC 15438 / GSS1) TaxID=273116 RepID=Q97BN4_THEVO|nr:50S ribosomal protein P1 [Thermoplasma volcanium]BAB59563.1 ribosomal protein large subunit P2 [Thermoplasma volcanium GSS1]